MAGNRNRTALGAAVLALACAASLVTSPHAAAMDFFARTNPATLSPALRDLPLIVTEPDPHNMSDTFVIWISGDGGWSMLESAAVARLAAVGIPTVAINSFRYFDEHRSSRETAEALERIAEQFSAHWNRTRIIFVGYSFGADTGPAALAQSDTLRAELRAAIFLSPSHHVYRHEGPTSWLGLGRGQTNIEALRDLSGVPIICVQGQRDRKAACTAVDRTDITQIVLPTGHTLHGQSSEIADLVIAAAHPELATFDVAGRE